MAHNGSGAAFESLEGQSVYYMLHGKDPFSSSLWRMPVTGGEERQLLPSVICRAFSPVEDGIYFISQPGADEKCYIRFLSFATNNLQTVAPITRPFEGLSASPDGRFLLFAQLDVAGSDLMLVENFRPVLECGSLLPL